MLRRRKIASCPPQRIPFSAVRLAESLARAAIVRSYGAIWARPRALTPTHSPSEAATCFQLQNDPWLADFYGESPIDFDQAVMLADRLRTASPPGRPSRNFRLSSPVEMLAAVRQGESFRCGEICTLLSRLILAGGAKARVGLLLGNCYRLHVVTEMWSERFQKWCVIDTDTNYTLWEPDGSPCSVLDLHDRASRDTYEEIQLIAGSSFYRDSRVTLSAIPKYLCRGFALQPIRILPIPNPLAAHAYLGASYVGDSRLWTTVFRTSVDPADRATVVELFSSSFGDDPPPPAPPEDLPIGADPGQPDSRHERWVRAIVSWYHERVLAPLYEKGSNDMDFGDGPVDADDERVLSANPDSGTALNAE